MEHYLVQLASHITRDQADASAMAQDCAQVALIRIHERLNECREPDAFRTWARRIVSHVAIDTLRRQKRLTPLEVDENENSTSATLADDKPLPEAKALNEIGVAELRDLIQRAPISDRSRRTILGRYLDDLPDEIIAQTESDLAEQTVLPSHVQVTRAKNMAKLRKWPVLKSYLGQ